jgi:hypothetical protein
MRCLKYSKIITLGLFLITLSYVQCKKETGFHPYPCIKVQVTDEDRNVPIDSARVRFWIYGFQDTLTYFTNSDGILISERINNWFDKSIIIEASRNYPTSSNPDKYGSITYPVSPDILNAKDSITADTLYIPLTLNTGNIQFLYTLLPKRLDFLDGQYTSYFIILNESNDLLYWEIGENNTEWMSIYWIRMYNAYDLNHLKNRGYVKFQVNISKHLIPGTYDSSILVITDRGTTVIPVHVVVK